MRRSNAGAGVVEESVACGGTTSSIVDSIATLVFPSQGNF